MSTTLTQETLLADIPLEGNGLPKPLSCTLNYYDGTDSFPENSYRKK